MTIEGLPLKGNDNRPDPAPPSEMSPLENARWWIKHNSKIMYDLLSLAEEYKAGLVPVLTERLALESGIRPGTVLQYNGLGTKRKDGEGRKAAVERIEWEIPGLAMHKIGGSPSYTLKLREINADGKWSRVTHAIKNLYQWDVTGETLDLKAMDRA